MAKRITPAEYIEKLYEIGLTLLSPFTKCKDKHTFGCNQCGNVWDSTSITTALRAPIVNPGSNCCSDCAKERARKVNQTVDYKEEFDKMAIEILSPLTSSTTKHELRCKLCGKTWWQKLTVKLHNFRQWNQTYGCKDCNAKVKVEKNDIGYLNDIKTANVELLENYVDHDSDIKVKCLKCKTEYTTSVKRIRNSQRRNEMNCCPSCADSANKESKINPTEAEEIVQRLFGMDILTLEAYKGAHNHHNCMCMICGHEWSSTLSAIFQYNKVFGTNGCSTCRNRRVEKRSDISKAIFINKIEEKFEILGEVDLSLTIHNLEKVLVRNKQCGHEFEANLRNLAHRDVDCPTCNNEEKSKRLQLLTEERMRIFRETESEWNIYRSDVDRKTRLSYLQHQNIINPNNLPRGKAGQEGKYQLDHIVSVRICFENDVAIGDCAHYTNLQMLPWKMNLQKHMKMVKESEIPEILKEYFEEN